MVLKTRFVRLGAAFAMAGNSGSAMIEAVLSAARSGSGLAAGPAQPASSNSAIDNAIIAFVLCGL